MNCHECNEHLVPFAEGLLDGDTAAAGAAHIKTCEICRATADDHCLLREQAHAVTRIPASKKRTVPGHKSSRARPW